MSAAGKVGAAIGYVLAVAIAAALVLGIQGAVIMLALSHLHDADAAFPALGFMSSVWLAVLADAVLGAATAKK